MHALKEAATGAEFLDFHTFPKASHNDIFITGGRKYWDAKAAFLKKCTSGL